MEAPTETAAINLFRTAKRTRGGLREGGDCGGREKSSLVEGAVETKNRRRKLSRLYPFHHTKPRVCY